MTPEKTTTMNPSSEKESKSKLTGQLNLLIDQAHSFGPAIFSSIKSGTTVSAEEISQALNAPFTNKEANDLLKYLNAVSTLATERVSLEFPNGGEHHAAIVYGCMFENAHNMRMYCGDMNGDVSSKPIYLDTLKRFIVRGDRVRVLFEHKPKREGALKLLSALAENYNVDVRLATKDGTEFISQELNGEYHFATGDESMYRLETNIESYSAFVSFKDKKLTRRLNSIFDKAYYGTKYSNHYDIKSLA